LGPPLTSTAATSVFDVQSKTWPPTPAYTSMVTDNVPSPNVPSPGGSTLNPVNPL
jgi:hypothetical protein